MTDALSSSSRRVAGDGGPSRRIILLGAGGTLALAPLAGCAPTAPTLTPRHRKILADLCDFLIPATDTPGAVQAGCVDYVAGCIGRSTQAAQRALLQHLAPIGAAVTAANGWRQVMDRLEGAKPEAAKSAAQLRRWVLIGFYTSEAGASQELRYEPVPGRFDPDIPVTPDTRAFASDWSGVSMGNRRGG
jgi:hypothetical protein